MPRVSVFLFWILSALAACNPTPAPVAVTPTTPPGTDLNVQFGASLPNKVVYGPAGNVCVGELQAQTLAGTSLTDVGLPDRPYHVRVDVNGGTYTTSFRAAVGCDPQGRPNLAGPTLGPTTVTFSITYVGGYALEANPICISDSVMIVNSFDTAGGGFIDSYVEAEMRNQIHRHLDRQVAVTMQGFYNGGDPEVVSPRCSNWIPTDPSDVGL
jgi:hypothetical protein